MTSLKTVLTSTRFHEGERALQTETGMRERIERAGQNMIRDYMPDQHRTFFAGLRYLFTATVDKGGQPWASVLSGPVGFVATPTERTMQIQSAQPIIGPAFDDLQSGSPFGVLGLDLSNRRRNRMHGRLTQKDPNQVQIGVSQSFGNCPKYINTRTIDDTQPLSLPSEPVERTSLNDADLVRIGRADTFFIASHHHDGSGAEYEGADISHRGGAPGFVHVNGNALIVPDYSGNFLFNTLGNLLIEPRAGLLFIDFESGDLMQMLGLATIIRDSKEVERYPGAERLIRFDIDLIRHTPNGLPLRWRFFEASPFNPEI